MVKVVVDTFIYECGGDKGGDEGKSSSHFTNISILNTITLQVTHSCPSCKTLLGRYKGSL